MAPWNCRKHPHPHLPQTQAMHLFWGGSLRLPGVETKWWAGFIVGGADSGVTHADRSRSRAPPWACHPAEVIVLFSQVLPEFNTGLYQFTMGMGFPPIWTYTRHYK